MTNRLESETLGHETRKARAASRGDPESLVLALRVTAEMHPTGWSCLSVGDNIPNHSSSALAVWHSLREPVSCPEVWLAQSLFEANESLPYPMRGSIDPEIDSQTVNWQKCAASSQHGAIHDSIIPGRSEPRLPGISQLLVTGQRPSSSQTVTAKVEVTGS